MFNIQTLALSFEIRSQEKKSASRCAWRNHNREHINKLQRYRSRRFYAKHREERKHWNRKYKKEHRDLINAQARKYYRQPKAHARFLKASRLWCKTHPIDRRAYQATRKARLKGATIEGTIVTALIKAWKSKPSFVCYYCKQVFLVKKLHIDHIIPIVKGGEHSVRNICTACEICNIRKNKYSVTKLQFLKQPLLEI